MAVDPTVSGGVQVLQDRLEIGNNANINIDTASGGSLKVAGADISTPLANAVSAPVAGVAAGYKIARGTHTQAAATDNINTGLLTIVAAAVCLNNKPTVNICGVVALAGTAAGWIQSNAYKMSTSTAGGAVTPVDATTFSDALVINWIAVGT